MFTGEEVRRSNRLNLTSTGRVQPVGSQTNEPDLHVGSGSSCRTPTRSSSGNRTGNSSYGSGYFHSNSQYASRRSGGRANDYRRENGGGYQRSPSPVDNLRREPTGSFADGWGGNEECGRRGGGMSFFDRRDERDRTLDGARLPSWVGRDRNGGGNDGSRGTGNPIGSDNVGQDPNNMMDGVMQPTVKYMPVLPPGTKELKRKQAFKFARDNFKPPAQTFLGGLGNHFDGCIICTYMARGHGEYVSAIPRIEKDMSGMVNDEYVYSFIAQFWNNFIKGTVIGEDGMEGNESDSDEDRSDDEPLCVTRASTENETSGGQQFSDTDTVINGTNQLSQSSSSSQEVAQSSGSGSDNEFRSGESSTPPSRRGFFGPINGRGSGRKRKRNTFENPCDERNPVKDSNRKKRKVGRGMPGITASVVEHHFTTCVGAKNPRRVLHDQIKKLTTIQDAIYNNGLFCVRVEEGTGNNGSTGGDPAGEGGGRTTPTNDDTGNGVDPSTNGIADTLARETIEAMSESIQMDVVVHEKLEKRLEELLSKLEEEKGPDSEEGDSEEDAEVRELKENIRLSEAGLLRKMEKYEILKDRLNILEKTKGNPRGRGRGGNLDGSPNTGTEGGDRGGGEGEAAGKVSVKMREAGVVHMLGRTIVQYQKELQRVMEPTNNRPMAVTSAEFYSRLPVGDTKKISLNDQMVMQQRVREFSAKKGLPNSSEALKALSCYFMNNQAERRRAIAFGSSGGPGFVAGGTSAKSLQITQQSRRSKKNVTAPKYTA